MAIKSAMPVDETRLDTEVPGVIPRDQYSRPILVGADGVERSYTRSSTFGEALEDTYGVNMWGRGMVVYGMGKREDLRLLAASIPEPCGASDDMHRCKPRCVDSKEGKKELRKIREQAWTASGADRKANLGTALHALTDQMDHGVLLAEQGPKWDPILARYAELMEGFEVIRSEVFTMCDRWETAGTFDFWLRPKYWMTAPDGEVFGPGTTKTILGDKKTSASSKYFGAKFACQKRTYRDGSIVDLDTRQQVGWPDAEQPSGTWGLILHLPSNVELLDDAGWYWVDLTAAEELCELALAVRKVRKRKDLIVPVHAITAQHPDDVRRAGALSKIAVAKSVAALKMIRRSHDALWNADLQAAAVARRGEILADRVEVAS